MPTSFCGCKILTFYKSAHFTNHQTNSGVNKEDFLNHIPKMAKDAMDSGSPGNTIKDCTQQDLEKIYKKVINA